VRFENAFPARVPDGALPSVSVSPPVETAPPVTAGEEPQGDPLLEELERLRMALSLREEGAAKEKAGDLSGAADLFRRSLALAPDAELEEHLAALEKSRKASPGSDASPVPPSVPAEALARYEEGVALQRQGRYYEALLKYRESLAVNEDAALADYADSLERLLRERAQTLVTRAIALQKEGRLEEALAAYRKSLENYPDPRIAAYAEKLEAILKTRRNP
jgi:tetratricopeptide (TPR) repeat protein